MIDRSPSRRAFPGTGIVGLVYLLLASPAQTTAQTELPGDDVCRVFGRVVDAITGDPVAGVSIWLEGADEVFLVGRQSSTDGSYALETSECGEALLRATMIGYVDFAEAVTFDGGGRRVVTIRLERDPVEVEALTVDITQSARLRDVGFYAREAWVEASGKDLGQFYDTDEFAARAAAGGNTLGIAMSARVRRIYSSSCTPSFYVDGVWFRAPGRAARWLRYGIQPKDIEGIEVYRAIHGSVPEEYRDPNSNTCGAVVVWTKKAPPAQVPRLEVELCAPSDDPNGISFGGVVADDVTGVHLPASYVTMMVTRFGKEKEDEIETVADAEGRYRYCDIGGWPSSLQAQYGTITAEAFEVDSTRAAPGYWEVDLKLAVIRTGSVVGVVGGVEGGPDALAAIEVSVEDADLPASPDGEGYFEIHDIMPGDHTVTVRRGDEVLVRREITVRSGATEVLTLTPDVP
jgi:hypothetical protein